MKELTVEQATTIVLKNNPGFKVRQIWDFIEYYVFSIIPYEHDTTTDVFYGGRYLPGVKKSNGDYFYFDLMVNKFPPKNAKRVF